YAWAYAPRCKQHHLNILTDTEDVRLPTIKNKQVKKFHLTGPKSGTTASSGYSIITCPWKRSWPCTEKSWNYVLRFPAPDSIFGLVREPVTIYGYPPESETECADYARALRFRYNDSPTPPQFEELSDNQISANHLGGAAPGYSI